MQYTLQRQTEQSDVTGCHKSFTVLSQNCHKTPIDIAIRTRRETEYGLRGHDKSQHIVPSWSERAIRAPYASLRSQQQDYEARAKQGSGLIAAISLVILCIYAYHIHSKNARKDRSCRYITTRIAMRA